MPFDTNVFINCPFDTNYKRFLEASIYTVLYCGYFPQVSETRDSGSARLLNIITLIKSSKYGIHDLSRMVAEKKGDVSRFNMPFELGLDLGIRNSGLNKYSGKVTLVIDSKSYRYQAALSDISGNDIEVYHNDLESLIRIIRNWLPQIGNIRKPGPKLIWEDFNEFTYDYREALKEDGFSSTDIANLPRSEFISLARAWIDSRKNS